MEKTGNDFDDWTLNNQVFINPVITEKLDIGINITVTRGKKPRPLVI